MQLNFEKKKDSKSTDMTSVCLITEKTIRYSICKQKKKTKKKQQWEV